MENMPLNNKHEGVERERKLSRWIIILLLFASTVMILQGVYNLSNLKKVDASIDSVYQTANRLDSLARDITKPVADIRLLSKQLVLSPNVVIAQETEEAITAKINQVKSKLDELKVIIIEVDQFQHYQANFNNIISAWERYLDALNITKKYQKNGIRVAAFLSVTKQEKLVYEQLQQSISDFSTSLLAQSKTVYNQAHEQSNLTYITLLVTVIIEIVILKFILFFVWRMFRSFIRATDEHDRAINNERQQLLHTLNSSPVGVGVTTDAKLVYVNDKLSNMLGIKIGDDVNNNYVDNNQRTQLMSALEEQEIVSNFDVQLYGKDNQKMDFLSNFYRMDYDSTPSVLAWFIDVSDLKTAERKNIEAKQLAEEATQAKSDFLANMSHEIRTPMNAIIGLSELALESDLSTKQYGYINKVHRSAESLLGIINDILDFSKIEAGKLNIEQVSFRLEDVLDNVSNLLSIKAEEKDVELLFDIENDLPTELIGDPLRLGQILINLGNNAVKFTDKGEVIIAIRSLERNEQQVKLLFEVTDTGIGIAPDKLTSLFNSFTQADNSTTRQYGGTGLGLTISKSLTELMGGKISCKSTLTKGSTFSFSTLLTVCDGTLKPARADNIGKLSVLVVDDNNSSREIITNMLNHLDLSVKKAKSGQEALEAIHKAEQESAPYDLVIMDWKMPVIDGIEATRLMQEDQTLSAPPMVIMVTAYGRDAAMQAVNESDVNINSFLTKPITQSSLLDAILLTKGKHAITKHRKNNRKEEIERAIGKLKGAKVLLAEDNEINMELAVDILERHQISVVTATNGQEVLDCLEQEDFDGIIMDCQMPVMDGYEATIAIRKIPKYQNLPILALTANAMVGDRDKVLAVGMNEHIAKPIRKLELFLAMERWITPQKKSPITVLGLEDPIQQFTPEIVGLDVKAGLEIFSNNVDLYKKSLLKFAKTEVDFSDKFIQSQASNDSQAPARCAHSLRGLAANITAYEVQQAAAELELNCANIDQQTIQLSLNKVQTAVNKVVKAILSAELAINEPGPSQTKTNSAPLSELVTILLKQAENYDAGALATIETIQKNHGDENKDFIELALKAVSNFDFDTVKILCRDWLNTLHLKGN